MATKRGKLALAVALSCFLSASLSLGGVSISVAVASDFASTLQKLVKIFKKKTHITVDVSPGATGSLYAQIIHGAPYDVFLSADAWRPKLLDKAGKIVPDSRFTYAIGRLVLWLPGRDIHQEGLSLLRQQPSSDKMALANPKLAPYGIAAKETLKTLHRWKAWLPHMVFGENIGQTYNFVASKNASLGFVALSQVNAHAKDVWRVPSSMYHPIQQQAVLLSHAKGNKAAYRFIHFLKSKQARRVIKASGYALPRR